MVKAARTTMAIKTGGKEDTYRKGNTTKSKSSLYWEKRNTSGAKKSKKVSKAIKTAEHENYIDVKDNYNYVRSERIKRREGKRNYIVLDDNDSNSAGDSSEDKLAPRKVLTG